MTKEKLNQEIFQCNHLPKKFRLTIDGGLNKIFFLELCPQCNFSHGKKFVIKEEDLEQCYQKIA